MLLRRPKPPTKEVQCPKKKKNPSSHTTALGLTQPLTEMSTRNISWGGGGKGGRGMGGTTLPPSCADCLAVWEPQPCGTFRPVMGLLYLIYIYTGRFIMFSVITNIYNKKTKGPSLMELFTATGKLETNFFDN
jgi:hypothetical protein